ncbi:hypothetical protein GNIT_0049 [Glaciecola nitratireducens FR1064]|uniref:Uncharacterized protein n=1 Tax=Glaciecola nitratireducens (strain JCM 12485 / KCTC 12276 / FR1064) TaxID=1085623 RepID=G4QEU1_GLANF|nr:hypothetical protein GNIT_0049 [Glaciecola nitratireducens FR1064]
MKHIESTKSNDRFQLPVLFKIESKYYANDTNLNAVFFW